MNDDIVDEAREDSDILKHVSDACARVAPTWPLDQFIAVNPWWNLVQQPFASAMSSLRRSGDIRTHMPREILRELHRSGALQDAHLRAVCVGDASAPGVDTLKAAINGAPPVGNRLPLVTDIADAARDLGHAMAWRDYVTHHISQQCAAWFDNAQAAWHAPHAANLYAHWRQYMLVDRSPRLLMGHRSCADRARALPADALASIAMATRALNVPAGLRAEYYSALLLSINLIVILYAAYYLYFPEWREAVASWVSHKG